MGDIIWFYGSDGVYFRRNGGPVEKAGPIMRAALITKTAKGNPRVVQAADQPDYIRWPH